jgi:hypothetical protein
LVRIWRFVVLAGNYNIIIDQGAHFERLITVADPDGDPLDLTGWTARMQIRTEIDAETVMVELTTENGRISLGGAAGTITLTLTADITEDMDDEGVYDLELIDTYDRVYRLLKGKVKVELEVTR